MTTSLTELIISLRKLNPTFTDEDIRGHLINMGNPKESVENALRIVNGGSAPQIPHAPDADMSKGVVFEEEGSSTTSFADSELASPLPSKVQVKNKHHRIRWFLIILILIILMIVGSMFWIGSLTTKDFKSINIKWGQLANVEYLKKEAGFFYNGTKLKFAQTINIVKSKFMVSVPENLDTPLMKDAGVAPGATNSNERINLQIQKVSKLRNALNAYAGVYGTYPSALSLMLAPTPNAKNVTLPALTDRDIRDEFTNQAFTYVVDPKVGFNLSYSMTLPGDLIQTELFYNLVEYRLIYDAKAKKSSFKPMLRFVNGVNTANRDILSLESLKAVVDDTNQNSVPDLLE